MRLKSTGGTKIDGSRLKIAIVLPYFNDKIGLELLENAKEELKRNGVKGKNITLTRVAGALEIPFACQKIALLKKPDAIIALGVIIKGETGHYDLVCKNTYEGIMKVQLENKIPISFGILTCENIKQAKKRASKNGLNKGKDAALAILIQTSI
ncbi:MAG: 6,7-dimethyl-8-ribityllumazine synthase [Patescibacteria group bacterium]